jgi:hypothetical protein
MVFFYTASNFESGQWTKSANECYPLFGLDLPEGISTMRTYLMQGRQFAFRRSSSNINKRLPGDTIDGSMYGWRPSHAHLLFDFSPTTDVQKLDRR